MPYKDIRMTWMILEQLAATHPDGEPWCRVRSDPTGRTDTIGQGAGFRIGYIGFDIKDFGSRVSELTHPSDRLPEKDKWQLATTTIWPSIRLVATTGQCVSGHREWLVFCGQSLGYSFGEQRIICAEKRASDAAGR